MRSCSPWGRSLKCFLTFQVFLVSLQFGGQQTPQGPQTAERRHHGVFIVHVHVVIAVPAAQTAAGTSSSSSSGGTFTPAGLRGRTHLPLGFTEVGNGVMLYVYFSRSSASWGKGNAAME